ncbi:MAG: MBL fold metallo-hydrolase [Nanoarchaeota archaeon]|nr:MBL fold metallo-hydrolase [Nanoarchaeota archaeon]MCG2717772.1 MBL fold metallo-hydrolase [Nanoarchaeota archaeon]
MTSLTFYGGVSEVGGNKIMVEDRGTKILLDFGIAFNSGDDYWINWLQPRGISPVKDRFEFGMLPKIKGLYRKDLLKGTDLKYVKPEIDAVFCTHAHFDHVGYLGFIDENIPVYLGECTKLIMETVEEQSTMTDYGEHLYRTFRTGKKIKIGSMEVEPVHVDHSIPAAYGYIVHTSEGSVVYTGDLRMHGVRADMTEEFIRKAKDASPVAMVSEGTRIGSERKTNHTEKEVKTKSCEVASKTRKLVIATFYPRDIDRLRTFYQVAKDSGRKFVVSLKAAHLLSRLKEDKRLPVPDVTADPNILVYLRPKKTYRKWEQEFLDDAVDCDYVHKNQSKLLLNLGLMQFAELIDIRPDKGSHFIHSMSEPFSDEDIEDEVMHNWLDHFGLNFHQLHASGHCSGREIIKNIQTINPKKVFPVHTGNPEMFKKLVKDVKVECPSIGRGYNI